MAASMYGGYGATSFPLQIPLGNHAIDFLDLQQACIGLLLKDAINAELGDEWRRICSRLEDDHFLNRSPGALPVVHVVDMEPSPAVLGQTFAQWPILAVYREGTPTTTQQNIDGESGTAEPWAVDWVIGPLDHGDQARVGKFANAVANLVRYVTSEGFHPAHQNGVCVTVGIFSQLHAKGQMGPGVAQVIGDEKGNGYYGISIQLEGRSGMVKTCGHISDVRNKYYAAFTRAPVGTSVTQFILAATIDNQTPDPVTP
jgi:hypothetical protein